MGVGKLQAKVAGVVTGKIPLLPPIIGVGGGDVLPSISLWEK